MALTKAQMQATAKYNAKVYDRLEFKVPKGQKAVIQEYAKSKGYSLNGYINMLIDEDMKRG